MYIHYIYIWIPGYIDFLTSTHSDPASLLASRLQTCNFGYEQTVLSSTPLLSRGCSVRFPHNASSGHHTQPPTAHSSQAASTGTLLVSKIRSMHLLMCAILPQDTSAAESAASLFWFSPMGPLGFSLTLGEILTEFLE